MSLFNTLAKPRIKKSKFDKSHERKQSFNMGDIVPMYFDEVIPGDKFRVNSEIMIRLAPMLAPLMHRVNVYTHFFYVPNRLVWNEWEDFITGGERGDKNPVKPKMRFQTIPPAMIANLGKGRLSDYLGVPPIDSITEDFYLDALPFRAYQLIYNEYYRDQNLQDPIDFSLDSGLVESITEISELCLLRKRAWEKDYFTSAQPMAQKGPEVKLPVDINYYDNSRVRQSDGSNPSDGSGLDTTGLGALVSDDSTEEYRIENIEDLGITINDLRTSVKLQQWFEKAQRAGSRYKEVLMSFFGMSAGDSRLDRPEYLGGAKQPIVISEVLSTATSQVDEGGTPVIESVVGEMRGHGISVGASNGFQKTFPEHGFVFGLMSVLPRTSYQDGLHRMWSRDDKFAYAWPEFANLGEQEIKNKEVFLNANDQSLNEVTWGYQSRYAEYKYGCSSVHGDFRDDLDFWHMGRKFVGLPNLNENFIESDPTNRIFNVIDPGVHKLYCNVYNRVSAIRPLPYYGTPRL